LIKFLIKEKNMDLLINFWFSYLKAGETALMCLPLGVTQFNKAIGDLIDWHWGG